MRLRYFNEPFRDKNVLRCAFEHIPSMTSCYRPKGNIFTHCCAPALLLEHVVTKGMFSELYLSSWTITVEIAFFVAENVRCVFLYRNGLWSNKCDN